MPTAHETDSFCAACRVFGRQESLVNQHVGVPNTTKGGKVSGLRQFAHRTLFHQPFGTLGPAPEKAVQLRRGGQESSVA
jgi:hypothetical protein